MQCQTEKSTCRWIWATPPENGREPIVKGCGTVVFEPDKCLASDRRGYRRQRRHIRATRTRILRMKEYLLAQGVLTSAVAGLQHPHPEPWRLAAQALRGERVLTAPELWAVLLWYAHNRGYDGNRLWSAGRGEEDKEDTKKIQAAKDAMAQFGTTTMAETVLESHRPRLERLQGPQSRLRSLEHHVRGRRHSPRPYW